MATMIKKAQKEQERQRAINSLRKLLKPGDTIYTALKHVSRSGMYRRLGVYVAHEGEVVNVSGLVSEACGMRWCNDGSVGVGGCGMDMGFHVAYELGYVLFGKQFECIGEGCPSNDHSNGDRDYTPHTHSDGGYALRHRWI